MIDDAEHGDVARIRDDSKKAIDLFFGQIFGRVFAARLLLASQWHIAGMEQLLYQLVQLFRRECRQIDPVSVCHHSASPTWGFVSVVLLHGCRGTSPCRDVPRAFPAVPCWSRPRPCHSSTTRGWLRS